MSKFLKRNTQYVVRITYCVFLFLAACTPAATPTYFIPPTPPSSHATITVGATIATPTPGTVNLSDVPATQEEIATQAPDLPSPTPACTNILSFVEDVTVTDGTVLAAGEAFIKQWRVKNDGTCDWNSSYKLKLVSGETLASPAEIALYPAPSGAEAVIEMNLIAPTEAGTYHTVWQAYAPDGTPFEQAIYVEIVVQ